MDKINLPVPGAGGPHTYDNSFVLFERIKDGEFQINLGNPKKKIAQWKLNSRAKNLIYNFSGGREYGFF